MIGVLLVDDERSVLNLLRHFITNPEFEILADTQSSVEAVDLARRLQPDVVISDIRMPELSGIDMVRQIQETQPETEFIMISGYQDFEYAYNALKLGVSEYLLKPIRQTELLEALDKLAQKRRGCQSQPADAKEQERRFEEESRSVKKKNWLRAVIRQSEDMVSADDGFDSQPEFFSGGGYKYVQGIIIKIDYYDPQQRISAQDVSRYTQEVCRYVMSGVSGLCPDMEYITEGNRGYILLCHNISSETWDALHQRYDIFVKEENYKYEGHLVATIGIGSRQVSLAQAPLSFLHARQALHGRIEFGVGKILEYDSRNFWSGEKLIHGTMLDRYFAALQSMDQETAVMELRRLFDCRKMPEGKGGCCYAMAEQLMELTVVKLVSLLDSVQSAGEDWQLQAVLENCYCPEHVLCSLERWLKETMAHFDELLHRGEGKLIRKAKAFVNENYSKPIGLNETAEVVSLNPIYFSAVFKEQTGEKFTTYLQNVRISKAKELLKTTGLSVKKVAEQVGYLDEKYFSRLFFKTTGVKPAEYRKYYASDAGFPHI